MSTVNPVQLPGDSALFQLLVDAVEEYAIFALDDGGHIASWNQGARQIKGYAPDEAMGRHFSLFFTPEDREAGRPERLLREAREHGRALDEGWRVRKDGTRFWASVVLTPLRSDADVLLGYGKVTRDLTQRREAEQALLRRERQLSETQALAGLGSWEWDVVRDRVHWTDELYRIYGLDPDGFEGTFATYLALVHPEDRDRVRSEVERAWREGGPFGFEERIVRADGSVRVLRSRGRVVRDGQGATTHLLGSCLDITDLRDAQEKALAGARELAAREAAEALAGGLRFLVRAGEVLASSMDYDATLHNVVSLAVPAIADWCAVDLVQEDGTLARVAVAHPDAGRMELARRIMELYPPRREGGTGGWSVIDSGQPEHHGDLSDEVLQTIAEDETHLEMLRSLGLSSALTVPLAGRNGILGVLTLVQAESGRRLSANDVSVACELGRHAAEAIENARLHGELEERNLRLEEQAAELEMQADELQAQIAHAEELMAALAASNAELQERTIEAEQANRTKSEFLAAMSHELRTPLNAIFGYADLIQLGVHGPVTTAQDEALERIKRNQNALLVLINDLLNFAKLEAGGLDFAIDELPVREILADLESVVGPQLAGKGLHYECGACAPDLHLRGDRERIAQILMNLLTNAIKFTEEGGRVALSVDADPSVVRIHVSDTGRGIPADRQNRIFDPFVQIERQPGASGTHGVGLGLAISRDLAAAMGGTLTVRSEVGRGSTFTLELPAVR